MKQTMLKIITITLTILTTTTFQQIVYTNATPQIPPLTNCILFPQHYSTPNSTEFKNLYCGTAVTWNLTVSSFSLTNENHTKALTLYQEMYDKYLKNADRDESLLKNNGVNIDCIAVLRKIICAYYFPICNEDEEGKANFGICTHSCELLTDRCPTETDLYQFLCGEGSREDKCAGGPGWASLGLIVGFILLLIGVDLE